jgi:uncharacterized membrane protein YeaQ/YmgE (transglycosylase-associated protein family)
MTLTFTTFVLLLLVAGVCGGIEEAVAGNHQGGLTVSIAIAFIGSIVGIWLGSALRLPELFTMRAGGERFPIVWSMSGSVSFVLALSLLTRSRATTHGSHVSS